MATRYWVLGTGSWDAVTTTNWSTTSGGSGGASVPGTSDNVIFDSNSGGGTTTVTSTQSVVSITFSSYGGTLDTNGYDLTLSGTFNLGSGGTRALTLGSSSISCDTWTVGSSSGLTFSRGTSTITITGAGTMLVGNSVVYNTVIVSPPANSTFTTTGSCTFTTLTINCHASGYLNFSLGANGNIGTLNLNGASSLNRLFFTGSSFGNLRTISGNSLTTGQYVDIQDIYITSFPDLSAITGGSGDCGGNNGITFTSPTTQHWIAPGNGAGNWSDSGNWTSRVPLPQDNVVMDFAFTGSPSIVTVDVPRIGNSIDWTGATTSSYVSWDFSMSASMFGSLTLNSTVALSNYFPILSSRSACSLVTTVYSGSSLPSVVINAFGGTYTLGSDLTVPSSDSITLNSGTLATNGYSISSGSIIFQGTVTLDLDSATHFLTSSGTVWNMVSGSITINPGTSTIKIINTSNSDLTFNGNSKTYNNIWFDRGASTGDINISGNNSVFKDFKDTGIVAHSIKFAAGINTILESWSVNGNPGELISISSSTTGTHTLTKIGVGIVQAEYLDIQHSIASPGNTWFARSNCVDNQSISTAGSGWIFANHTVFRQPIRPRLFTPGFAR